MRRFPSLLLVLCFSPSILVASERVLLDEGWRFQLADPADAQLPGFDDAAWRRVDLPHDWSVEASPQNDAASEGHGGYHQTGVGWYRRPLEVGETSLKSIYRLEFDGVYQNAEVWVNGHRLGEHLYGYTPFSFDITPYLKTRSNASNVIAVRVDNSDQPNCRWYSGSGIYRHVWLRKLPPVHIEPASVWCENKPHEPFSDFHLHYTVINSTDMDQIVYVEESLPEQASQSGKNRVHKLRIGAGKKVDVHRPIRLGSARSWSAEFPHLQQLQLRLLTQEDAASDAMDVVDHTFGLRSVAIDPQRGLLLNGEPIVLFGGNVHHDHGPLGAASLDIAEARRVRLLKQAGFNAVRTSHNPPSDAFLDECDRQGLLVIDEFFDNWAKSKVNRDYGPHFEGIWRDELLATMDRDRRHPSVVMWSIGNEVYERGDESGQRLAQELAQCVREHDQSRPVTIGLNGLGEGNWDRLDPMFGAVDVCGYNYETNRYETDHRRLPMRVMYASESYPKDAHESFAAVESQPHVIGDFVWSAIDYLGEAGIGRVFPPGEEARRHWEGTHFPWRAAACGDIDLIGHRKPISHYRNIVWDRGERLYLAVEEPTANGDPWQLTPWAVEPCLDSWTWSVPEKTMLTVHAYSRYPQVRLQLNGRIIGEASTGQAEEFHASFRVPYEPGELVLEGMQQTAVNQRIKLATAGETASIDLEPEQGTIAAGRQSIAFINVRLVDEQGTTQPVEDRQLEFSVAGPAEIVATGNADPTSRHAYANSGCPTYQGHALAVLRSTGEVGAVTLTARCEGLPEADCKVEFTKE
ncbi:DUF4982 domain-containing protein [Aeoliella sp. ICT_H6.2]|uniref:DUF4982 domain-containing protein n=1 Tax=Aeoliella straminimaris TaxID=2954799 RepID=A0A9X2FDJ0_9BACT|nr:glycoside hydrolase family 2 TIM barrel-domain containing protein [Aeoliella straminimaris]MCO6046223.1 DUF4982 domain-containing protein [Aeoliella straminimaris]